MKYINDFLVKIKPKKLKKAIVETILINTIVYVIFFAFAENKSFSFASYSNWITSVPLFLSLLYGVKISLINIGFLILAFTVLQLNYLEINQPSIGFFVSKAFLFFIAGEFNLFWSNKILKLNSENSYLKLRMDEFTNNYYIVKASHDELERRFVTSSYNIKGSVELIRNNILSSLKEELLTERVMKMILKLFVNQFELYSASIHLLDSSLEFDENPIVGHGVLTPLNKKDPLINFFLEKKEFVSVNNTLYDYLEPTSPLKAVLPFIDSNGKIWAILAIENMSFQKFNEESFKLMSIMGSYISDFFAVKNEVPLISRQDWTSFSLNLKRALIHHETYGITSHLIVINLEKNIKNYDLIVKKAIKSLMGSLDNLIFSSNNINVQYLLLSHLKNEFELEQFLFKINNNLKCLNIDACVSIKHHTIGSMDNYLKFVEEEIIEDMLPAFELAIL